MILDKIKQHLKQHIPIMLIWDKTNNTECTFDNLFSANNLPNLFRYSELKDCLNEYQLIGVSSFRSLEEALVEIDNMILEMAIKILNHEHSIDLETYDYERAIKMYFFFNSILLSKLTIEVPYMWMPCKKRKKKIVMLGL